MSNKVKKTKQQKELSNILNGKKNKLIVIIGPCSIHSQRGCLTIVKQLTILQNQYKNLHLCMRAYFEKPRTTIGWKGLIYDPELNNTYKINKGIIKTINILKQIHVHISIATEFLNTIIANYINKYINIGTIGARNCESQIHRELAAYSNIPIGFKNNTLGELSGAINSITACKTNNNAIYINKHGQLKRKKTLNNKDCFLILRGGTNSTNYKAMQVNKALKMLINNNINTGLIIDVSHDNSKKIHTNQIKNIKNIAAQLKTNHKICGIMIEANIKAGKQSLKTPINPWQSITDACTALKTVKPLIAVLNTIIKLRKPTK